MSRRRSEIEQQGDIEIESGSDHLGEWAMVRWPDLDLALTVEEELCSWVWGDRYWVASVGHG